ncbi:MAG TPA: hypothetical protein VFQ39_14645, partial [Longimicrobium sp.]|nr:hypothetical protein [Longimicrobium sp.]
EGTVLARSGTITGDYSECPFVCPASYYCGPVTLASVQCSYYCEHGPGWSQYCPEEDPETLG